MVLELIHIEQNQLKGLDPAGRAIRARQRDSGLDFGDGDFARVHQQRYVFVGTFDVLSKGVSARWLIAAPFEYSDGGCANDRRTNLNET